MHSPVDVNNIQAQHTKDQGTSAEFWDPTIDLSHLDEGQRQVVHEMLREESNSFSQSGSDIGCIEKLHLKIELKDPEPVVHVSP